MGIYRQTSWTFRYCLGLSRLTSSETGIGLLHFYFCFLTGNDSDGSLRYSVLVIMAHMGRHPYVCIITPLSSLWNDVPIQFFLEEQFLCYLPTFLAFSV